MTNISSDTVKAQLERILASSEFMAGKRLGQFLRYVVEQTLNGQSDRIKQYTVAVEALGYGADFDPQSNPTVRIHVRKLRRALDQYYFTQGIEDPIRIDIPKGSYIPVFLDNHTAPEASDLSECPSPVPEKIPLDSSDPTIAVIMFENLNENKEDAFFAVGLTKEILISLTRFSGLSVLGPLVHADKKTIDLDRISHESGARYLLQGGVRSQGSRVRISTDLTDALSGHKLWGRTFEYDLEKTTLFEIESEVTSKVVGVVADGLGMIFRQLFTESYSEHIKFSDVTMAILKYNYAWMTHDPQDWKMALAAVSDALEMHPTNALLVALLSNTYYAGVLHELKTVPGSLIKMQQLANEAVSLDPDLQIAQYNLVVQNAFWGRVNKCIEQAQKVVEMNPYHARILAGCAVATTSVGAYDIGLELIERAKKLNPHYPGWYHFINYLVCFGNEQYKEAWIEAQKIHVEGLFWHSLFRASILGKLGRIKEAEIYVKELLRIKPKFSRRPKEYIKLLFVLDEHVGMVWDGLQKAGMRELE